MEVFRDLLPDLNQLFFLSRHYAAHSNCSDATVDQLMAFLLHDQLARGALEMSPSQLTAYLSNDAYKPRMHRMYAMFMGGVSIDFELNVRKAPMTLAQIRREDPELWSAFEEECRQRLEVPAYPPPVVASLQLLFDHFDCPEVMLRRAAQHGVAPISWERVGARGDTSKKEPEEGGELVAYSHGPAEASSHVETSLTQLVQELVIHAQVRQLAREQGVGLTPTHLLANSLARLARQVERLNTEVEGTPTMTLFAGRRSSSRRYLLLQNRYCKLYLKGYGGTSSVLCPTLYCKMVEAQGGGEREKEEAVGKLRGTLAHEVMMTTDQLLGRFNDLGAQAQQAQQGRDVPDVARGEGMLGVPGSNKTKAAGLQGEGEGYERGQAQICALLAHLLILRSAARGSVPLSGATALSDTFGTRGFVSAALAAKVPPEFLEDMGEGEPGGSCLLPQGLPPREALVFDLFNVWRMDSGDYEEIATYVMDAWESRWSQVPDPSRPAPPRFMHSDLSSVDEIVAMSKLPHRIRPSTFAFGTLADGFLPFDLSLAESMQQAQQGQRPQQEQFELKLCSVVMKSVQARHPGVTQCSCESAGKLGDGHTLAKVHFDRRLPTHELERTKDRFVELSRERRVDPSLASAALAAAYHAVTREMVLDGDESAE